MKLSALSITRPVATLVLILAVVVLGVFSLVQLPVNLLPDITYPLVKVYIPWRGATPAEIEDSIAVPVERKLATVDGLDYLDTQCTEGLYTLFVYFDYSVDRDVAYQDVLAKMGIVRKSLPPDAEEPQILKADPSQLPVMDLIVTSRTMDLTKLRTWAENSLQDQFASIPGTAGSEVSGGLVREVRVLMDPERLQHYGLSPAVLVQKLRDENLELLGGRVTSGRQEILARTLAEYRNLEDIRSTAITTDRNGRTVYLRDLASVVDAHRVQRVITRLNGQEGVKISLFKQAGANTVQVEAAIRQRLKELQETLPPGVEIGVIYNQADYIHASVNGVRDAALIAALLVVLVSAFFLVGWRRVAVVAATLPVSLLATFFVMKLAGFSINILSLGGLVVAITVLLDNCVVVVENITRLQTEHPEEAAPVERGAGEVAGAVMAATITFLALFLPFLLVSGLTSLLFRELVLTVATAIVASLVVSLTLSPTLMALFFPPGAPAEREDRGLARLSSATLSALYRGYSPLLTGALRFRWAIIGVTALLFALGVWMLPRLGTEFLPEMDDGRIIAKVKMPTGASVEETGAALTRIQQAVQGVKGIQHTSTLVGGRILGLVTTELSNEGEVDIQLVPRAKRRESTPEFVAKLSEVIPQVARTPGARIKVMHAKVQGIRTTGDYDMEAEFYSPRAVPLEDLAQTAQEAMGRLKDVPGLVNLDTSVDITEPEYQVSVDRERAADYGLTANQVASSVRTMVDGTVASEYKEGGYYYDIRALLDEEKVQGRQDIEGLMLPAPRGGALRLRDVARVEPGVGPTEVDRKDQMRVIKVTGMAQGRSVGDVNRDAAKALAGMALPAGFSLKFGGQAQTIAENFRALAVILILALFLSYVVLAVQFESWILPFIILVRVPLSIVGMTLALWLTGTPLGVTVMIGVILLAGIEVNHGVLLLTVIGQRRAEGVKVEEAIRQAARLRLRPILMTALVGIVGLLPLALGLGDGTETLRPMAIAVIGGLIFSLFLTFFFMPALYLAVTGRAGVRANRRLMVAEEQVSV
jgi:HAE1 family hydrophobic/amphiphilic exporter-1